MDIEDWRRKIDALDQQLVKLINDRANCAVQIGKLKQDIAMPVYEPDRERIIFDNIARLNQGPLSQIQLRQVYERLIDVMRQVQTSDMTSNDLAAHGETELEPKD